ncbi:hypothetical protein FVEN_g4454 [Fusarium venenatum]|uniref:Uncharacterized protein n=1 Tax=Fusarium venenatum TaxID=56646 RepID=A0A2L2T5R5_9HYPO|nr:uncharacterized protein FVRRES_02656 [Fusarium venenatum]KAG8357945.1 hypothetical protein FVEN_g4454 [Fusarium venenatum]KAH7004256.1 hypothetical protein EDB82DRAFT_486413 [Fusarium venenatum]CEI66144.1 unnamed protein product [Fusarium venenatum]
MANEPRVEWFLSKANLNPPLRLSHLTIPADQDFLHSDLPNRDKAHSLLVQTRKCSPNYKPPESQVWHHFRTRSQKAAVCNTLNWTFAKHELARAFDALLSQPMLPPTGVAQALLMQARLSSMDELWGHLHDQSLERKFRSKRLSSDIVQFETTMVGMTWLDRVVSLDNINYIHLICQLKVSQAVLDRALGIALSKSSLRAMKLLLSFGAVVLSDEETIDQHIRAGNLELIELLLSAPDSMGTGAWKECLHREILRATSGGTLSVSFLLLLLANRPELVSASLLLSTLRLENFQATAIVMAYSGSSQIFFNIRHQAFELISRYPSNTRLAFFTLLSNCELIEDSLLARKEVLEGVKARDTSLVKLLVGDGVTVDEPSQNALKWAVSQLDFEMIEILTRGSITSSPTLWSAHIPEIATEQDMSHIWAILRSVDPRRQSLAEVGMD